MKSILAAVLLLAPAPGIDAADRRTSANDDRVAAFFRQNPAADANKDGLLTWEEAAAYRNALQKRKPFKQSGARKAGNLQPDEADVRYGSHPRNHLDFFRAKSNEPTPLLIYWHGGGFVAGDKAKARNLALVRTCLDNGIAVVSGNYRFVKGQNSEPFPGSLMDGVRTVQFVRSKAKEWNIDPKRIVLSGGSAGAMMSLWIAVHDDFANPKSGDPVERFSSRVSGVISYGGPTTVDPRIIVKAVPGNPDIHPSILPIFAVASVSELESPDLRKKVVEFSPLSHVTPDDPPLMMIHGLPLASSKYDIHHSKFGRLMLNRYHELNHPGPVLLKCPDGPDKDAQEIDFLKQVFSLER